LTYGGSEKIISTLSSGSGIAFVLARMIFIPTPTP
jgi:uncharacterized membrane protein